MPKSSIEWMILKLFGILGVIVLGLAIVRAWAEIYFVRGLYASGDFTKVLVFGAVPFVVLAVGFYVIRKIVKAKTYH